MKKRLFCLLLTLIIALSLFSACASPVPTTPSSEKTEEVSHQSLPATETKEALPPLSDLRFDGQSVNILVENGRFNEFYSKEYTDELINDSIYDRNIKVETDLNVKLNFIESAHRQTAFVSDLETAVSAGTNDYDIAVGYAYFMASGVHKLLFADLYEMPHLDLSSSWWNQAYVEEASVADHLYTLVGDPITSTLTGIGAMYFNKRLADEEYAELGGSDYLYRLAADGKWTMDKFTDLVKDCYRDLDDDRQRSPGDLYAFGDMLVGSIPADAFLFGMGAFVTEDNAEGIPEFVFDRPHTKDVLRKFSLMFSSEGVYNDPSLKLYSNPEAALTYRNKFKNGTMVFYADTLGTAKEFSDMTDKFGLLPMPKFDEEQSGYYSAVEDSYLCLAVPYGIERSDRAEMVGATLEKLGKASARMLTPNLFIENHLTPSDDTMYQLILKGRSFCFGSIFSSELDNPSFAFRHLIPLGADKDFDAYWEAKDADVKAKFKSLVHWFVEE